MKTSVWLWLCDALLCIPTACQQRRKQKLLQYLQTSYRGHFSLQGGCYSCSWEGGFVVHALQPSGPRTAIFGGETITFQKELWGFSFDVVWGYCMVHAGECWGQGGLCMRVSMRVRAAVRVTWQGYISQRAAGPDVWLPLTVHSRRGWSGEGPTPSPPFPRTKARAQLIDVNSVAFVPKAQRHAEWEIWPLLRVRLCFWTPLAVSGRSGQRVSERMRGKGEGVRWRGVEVCPDWCSVQVGGGGGFTQEERHDALLLHLTLSTTN